MLKKYIKLIIYAIVMFLISSLPTSARLMNLDDFIEHVKKVDESAGYVYIIGEYAFTSTHELKTPDVMIGARTINITDADGYTKNSPIYNKMTIQSITHQYSDTLVDLGWKIDAPILGTTPLLLDKTNSIDIKYINYTYVPDKTNFEISNNDKVDDLQEKLTEFSYAGNDNAGENLKYENNTLSGLIYRQSGITAFPDGIGYYYAFNLKLDKKDNTPLISVTGVKNYKIIESSTNSGEYIVLVSLDGENPSSKITITADLDGKDKEDFDETTLEINLDLEYQGESKANFEIGNIPESEITDLENTFGYIKNTSYDTYTLDNLKFKDNVYLHTLKDEAFGREKAKGYYLVFRVKPELITDKITISIPCSTCEKGIKTLTKDDLVDNGLTVIFRLNPEDAKKEIKVTVDYDGEGNTYIPKDYILDYSEVNYLALTEYKIESITDDDTAKNSLQNNYEFSPLDGYQTDFTTENDMTTISGLLPIVDTLKSDVFTGEDLTKYYFAFKITLENDGTGDTVITIPNAKVIQDSSNKKVYYVLKSLKNTETEFNITIDVDNDKKNEHNLSYLAHTIQVNVEGLHRQQESQVNEINVVSSLDGLNEELSKMLTDAQYKIPTNPLTLNENILTGGVHAINLADGTFESPTGYYVPLLLSLPESTEATIKTPEGNSKISKVIDNKVLILYALEENDSKEIKIEVDLDGTSHSYRVQTYTISYSDITFKKEANVSFNKEFTDEGTSIDTILKEAYNYELNEQAKKEFELTYETHGNKITAKGFIPYVYNVTGFELEEQTNLYFPLVINVGNVNVKNNGIENNVEITVPCQSGSTCHDNKKIITSTSFDNNHEIVMLYRLDPKKQTKEFEIKVDLDGEKGNVYDAITYTIDYTNLKTPKASSLSFDFTDISDKQDLQDHNYTIPTEDGYILSVDDNDPKNIKLSGKIKYQDQVSLFSGVEQTGFYFAFDLKDFKIGDTINDKLLIKVKGDTEVMVAHDKLTDNVETILFAINPETLKDCGDNKCQVEITVDLDGDAKYYAPEEYTIDYSGITLEKSVISTLSKADSNTFDSYGYNMPDTYSMENNKITGYLERQKIHQDVFGNDNEEYGDYYLGLTLNFPEISKNMLITLSNTSSTEGSSYLTYKDLETDDTVETKKLNILKLLDFSKKYQNFTITVDLDGCRDSNLAVCQGIEDDNVIHYPEQTITVDISNLISLEEKVKQAYDRVKGKESAKFSTTSNITLNSDSYYDYNVKVEGSYDKDSYLFYIDYVDEELTDMVRYEYGVSGSGVYFDWSNTYKKENGSYSYLGKWEHEEGRDFNNAESLFKNTGIGILGHWGSNGIIAANIKEKDNGAKYKIELVINKAEANYFFNDAFNYEKVYTKNDKKTYKLKTALNNKNDIITKDVKATITINDYEGEELIDSIELNFASDDFSSETVQSLTFKSKMSDFNKVTVENPKDNAIQGLS